jgi:hypothetical protein
VMTLIMLICLAICLILKVNMRYVEYHPVASLVLSLVLLDALWMELT